MRMTTRGLVSTVVGAGLTVCVALPASAAVSIVDVGQANTNGYSAAVPVTYVCDPGEVVTVIVSVSQKHVQGTTTQGGPDCTGEPVTVVGSTRGAGLPRSELIGFNSGPATITVTVETYVFDAATGSYVLTGSDTAVEEQLLHRDGPPRA